MSVPALARALRTRLERVGLTMGVALRRPRGPLPPPAPTRPTEPALEERLDPERRWVEIGTARERVEIVDAPRPPPQRRTGRIRHANGENAAIEYEVLMRLMQRAEAERPSPSRSVLRA